RATRWTGLARVTTARTVTRRLPLTIAPSGSPAYTARYSVADWDLRPVNAKLPLVVVVPASTCAQLRVSGRPVVVTGRDWSTTFAFAMGCPAGASTPLRAVAPPTSTAPLTGRTRLKPGVAGASSAGGGTTT